MAHNDRARATAGRHVRTAACVTFPLLNARIIAPDVATKKKTERKKKNRPAKQWRAIGRTKRSFPLVSVTSEVRSISFTVDYGKLNSE